MKHYFISKKGKVLTTIAEPCLFSYFIIS